ncbi:MAG: hypothetical protein V4664_00670 [Patescibacteria group bacterium]
MKDQIEQVITDTVTNLYKRNIFTGIHSVVRLLRRDLYFSESFSVDDLRNRKTNCVGANYLCLRILKILFPNKKFRLVSIKYPAFENSGHISKHICVIEINERKFRFIDSTPMAGFFNGRVSSWLNLNSWNQAEDDFLFNKKPSFSDFGKIYSPTFMFLDEIQVIEVLEYCCLLAVGNDRRFLLNNLPLSWYAELLKDKAINSKNSKERKRFLEDSYKISSNPFTYLKIHPGLSSSHVIKDYIRRNNYIIKSIILHLKNNPLLSRKKYFEYLAVIYWKKSAIKKIQGQDFDFNYINVDSKKEYLYKIGKSYFKDNNLYLMVCFKKDTLLNPIRIPKSSLPKRFTLEYDTSKFLSIISQSELKKYSDVRGRIFSGYNAYNMLILLLSPEVIII